MRNFFRAIRCCECFLLLVFLAQACAAQSFIFVSPNTSEHMSTVEALDAQSSFQQRNFLAVAQYLGDRMCSKVDAQVKVQGGEGLDGHNTENTALITGCRPDPAVYLAELLGRYGRQKWVLVFSAMPNAGEQLFVITLAGKNPEEAISQLHKHGITEATVVLEGRGARVYIWTQNHEQDAEIHALSEDNHGTIEVLAGKGQLIGDDDRAKAQKLFDKALAAYEREHHVAFSREIQTKKLRKMGQHVLR